MNVSLAFSELASEALGHTVGTTITLDATAAGHGWYFDYTPWHNDEYLPTSNPYKRMAKPGSAHNNHFHVYLGTPTL